MYNNFGSSSEPMFTGMVEPIFRLGGSGSRLGSFRMPLGVWVPGWIKEAPLLYYAVSYFIILGQLIQPLVVSYHFVPQL